MHLVSCNALHVNAYFLALTNSQPIGRSLTGVDEQILNFLVVDLQHADCQFEFLLSFDSGPLDALEDFLASHGDDASVGFVPDHRVGLACAGLPIRK